MCMAPGPSHCNATPLRIGRCVTMAKEYRLSAERLEELKLYSRIAELDEILSNYTLIEEQENHMDMVHVGNNVVVKDLEFDETLHYQIVGSQEADPMNGRISEDSPFGRALLGKKAGEGVVVEAPAGNIRYQIVEIQR